MRTSRRILKNIFSLSLAEIASKGIQTVTVIYLARAISPEGLGIIGIANSYMVYFIFFASLGLDTIGVRELAKHKDKADSIISAVFTLRTILSVLSFAGVLVFIYFLNKPLEIKIVWLLTGVNIFSNGLLINWVFIGSEKMEVVALRQVLTGILNLVGIVIFVNDFADLIPAVAVMSVSMAINTFWVLLYYIKVIGKIKLSIDLEYWKSIIKSSLPVGFSFLLVIIYNNLSMNMLGFMRNDAETGFYNAAYRILLLALVPSSVLQSAFFPLFSRVENFEDREKVMIKFSLLSYLIGTFIGLALLTYSTPVIYIAYGSKYMPSSMILNYLSITVLIQYLNITYSSPLFAWSKERLVMYGTIAGGVVNLIMNWILIPVKGAEGAGIATIFSESAVFIVLSIAFYKSHGKLYLGSLGKLAIFSLLSCGVGYLLLLAGVNAIVSGIVCLAIFLLMIFVFKIVTIPEIKGYISK